MLITTDLREKEYLAKIVPKTVKDFYDPKLQGRYKVHIPDMMPNLPADAGIWVKNQVHKWRMTPSDIGEYGQYFPLQAGTFVMVKFFENDMNTGYIDRIISDYKEGMDWESQDNTTSKPSLSDRDEEYVIFKTPKKWNIMYVTEDTENEQNTIYLIYNRDNSPERRTVLRIDETGISWWTRDNHRVRIKLDDNKQVDGDQTEWVKGYRTKHVKGRDDLRIRNKQFLHVDLDRHKTILQNEFYLISQSKHVTTVQDEYKFIGGVKDKIVVGNESNLNVGELGHTVVGNKSEMILKQKSFQASTVSHNALIDFTITSDNTINIEGAGSVNICGSPVQINTKCSPTNPIYPETPDIPELPEIVKPETHVRDLGNTIGETPEYQEPDVQRMGRWLVRPEMSERPSDLGETNNYAEPGGEGPKKSENACPGDSGSYTPST